MGLFSNSRNQMIAEQQLKIIQDSVKLVNTTKNPDTYFERLNLLETKIDELINLKGVRYTGTSPKQMKTQLNNKRHQNTQDMIKRYYDDIIKKSSSLKTATAKRNKLHSFISTLETYYHLMDKENIQYIDKLYNQGLKTIKD